MAGARETAVELCETMLPETTDQAAYAHWNQIGFDHIAKNYGQGSGTTCGFLPHWLLWRLGCRDVSLVNRSAPDEGLTYLDGENLSIFTKTTRSSWVSVDGEEQTRALANGKGAKPGDFIMIRGGFWKDSSGARTRDSAHIFVLLEVKKADGKNVEWRVAQTGISNNARQQGGQIRTLNGELREGQVLEGKIEHKGPNLVFIANIFGEEPDFPRRVIGYNDLEKTTFGAAPDPHFTGLFEKRRIEPATNDPNKIMEWLGWWDLSPAGGFVNLGPSYILLERGHEALRFDKVNIGPPTCTAGGVWTRTGMTLDIEWDDMTRHTWTVAKTFVPHTATTGTPANPERTGAVSKRAKPPTDVPARFLMK